VRFPVATDGTAEEAADRALGVDEIAAEGVGEGATDFQQTTVFKAVGSTLSATFLAA
jgi:hypothetical protein